MPLRRHESDPTASGLRVLPSVAGRALGPLRVKAALVQIWTLRVYLAHPAHVLATSTGGLGRTPLPHVHAFSAQPTFVSANARTLSIWRATDLASASALFCSVLLRASIAAIIRFP